MAIGYRDFLPAMLESGFFANEHETLPAALARANEWITASGVRVFNVETVVLPNLSQVDQASLVGIRTSGKMSSYWFQVVRVWYEVNVPPVVA